MITGLDSAFPPSLAQARAAKLTGVQLWSGYISTAPYDGNSHFGLYHPWPQAGFTIARTCGSTPIAFCSGWDSPGALKALAAAWDVRLCLDIEGGGLRPDGSWKQAWLDVSGAGVYGNYGCHNCRAAFHVLSAYPGSGDVRATWWGATPRPPGPSGWQWAGTHSEFGIGVDRGDYDDWFHNGGTDMTPEEHDWLRTLHDTWLVKTADPTGPSATLLDTWVTARAQIADIQKRLPAGSGSGVDLGPLTAQLTAVQATLTKIEQALKGA